MIIVEPQKEKLGKIRKWVRWRELKLEEEEENSRDYGKWV